MSREERLDRYVCAALTGLLASQPAGRHRDGELDQEPWYQDPHEIAALAVSYAIEAMKEADR